MAITNLYDAFQMCFSELYALPTLRRILRGRFVRLLVHHRARTPPGQCTPAAARDDRRDQRTARNPRT
jgi:hypothetical protein